MELYNYFNFPKETVVDRKIKIDEILELLYAEADNLDLIKKYVAGLTLKAVLNFNTTSMLTEIDESYKYEEIQVFIVKLRNDKYFNDLNNLLHNLFPNPTVLLYEYQGKNSISVSKKRTNKNNIQRAVIEKTYTTEFVSVINIDYFDYFKTFDFNKNIKRTLKSYYEDLIDYTIAYYYYKVNKKIPYTIEEISNFEAIIDELNRLNATLTNLEKSYRSESNLSKKMQLDKEIKKTKSEIESLNSKLI
jgi:hypothetical protein